VAPSRSASEERITATERSLVFKLEPTFRCNLECAMCPRFSSEDPHVDMAPDVYARIHDAMAAAFAVDFTGWGESMLHKGIYSMIRQATERGCQTHMTTNGTLLNEKNCQALIDAGMSQLAVSIDGMSAETYDAIRTGARFETVTDNVKRLSRLVRERRSSLALAIAFTIQESNAHELPLIAAWMSDVGAGVLHLKQLNVVSNADDWQRSFLKYRLHPIPRDGARMEHLEEAIQRTVTQCRAAGVQVFTPSELPMNADLKGRHCIAAPLNSAYFSYEGMVSPCCHFGHHVSRYFEGRYYAPSALFFGDIRRQSFTEIWESPPFRAFREGFEKHDFPEACRTCYLLYGK
jgi:MoaA/NifB/PqqE/SkfB family radical SAM enzyme